MNRSRLPGTPEPDRYVKGDQDNRIAIDEWGDPSHQAVILLHGGGQTRHAWKGTGEVLANAGYHALSFDARGHGDSDWVDNKEYEHGYMVGDLVHLIEELGLSKPVLVGASMGGMVSMAALGEKAVDASALVLVDIAPTIEVEGAHRVLDFMRQGTQGFDSLEEVAEAIAGYQPQRERPRNLDGLAKNVRQGEDGRFYWHWDPEYISEKREVGRYQEGFREIAKNLDIPALLVRGGLSDVLSEEGAQDFLDLCPHAEYANVTEAAHMVAGDRNDIFTAAVVDFLSRKISTE